MPSQQRVRRGDRRNLAKGHTPQPVRPGSDSSAIVIRETQPPAAKLPPQEPVLFDQVRKRLALRRSSSQ
jgi:hypothetical protein